LASVKRIQVLIWTLAEQPRAKSHSMSPGSSRNAKMIWPTQEQRR